MKKRIILILLSLIALALVPGCKKERGEYYVISMSNQVIRNLIEGTTSFASVLYFECTNSVPGRVVRWTLSFFNKDEHVVYTLKSDDYTVNGVPIDVTQSPAQRYYAGMLTMQTSAPVPGDLFAGEEPAGVLLEATVMDDNDYESEMKYLSLVTFAEVKEEEETE